MSLADTDLPADPREAAHVYAKLGWPVVPIIPGKKHPGLDAWQTEATTDPEVIEQWWGEGGRFAGHGVGILTGTRAGLWVLDIDTANGKQGAASLERLIFELGEKLPVTVTSITGSGGRQLYFRLPPGIVIRNSAGNYLGPDLDVRGEGGQVCAVPTVHPSGAQYRWMPGRSPFELELAYAPEKLVGKLLGRAEGAESSQPVTFNHGVTAFDPRPGDWFNAHDTWEDLLVSDGWTTDGHVGPHGEVRWTRPGKDQRDGCSATTGFEGLDVLKVFTSSVPWLQEGGVYNRFAYLAQSRFRGDYQAAASFVRRLMPSAALSAPASPTAPSVPDPEEAPDAYESLAVDFAVLWGEDRSEEDWLIEPFIAKGRGHALYASAKTGKSYVALQAVAAACVPGHQSWAETRLDPIDVLYLDYEMTRADLEERLDAFGYGPEDDYSHLHYVMAAGLGADLDTAEGGRRLLAAAQRWGCSLVVVDTMSRAVRGGENDADTLRDFYACTGALLKNAGIALLRLDHAGKDVERGQRGSSAKNDDVDLVWELSRMAAGHVKLRLTHSRLGWVPPQIVLEHRETPDGRSYHARGGSEQDWPAGTTEKVQQLEEAGVDPSAGWRTARKAGVNGSPNVITAAQRWRRSHPVRAENLV